MATPGEGLDRLYVRYPGVTGAIVGGL